jgi:hypothetical protein
LAIIDRLLTVYGQNGACAYDIGCAFAKTIASSTLGERASSLNLQMMVGAFHGHAHNRRCQLDWHLMYIKGTGHTEGEGCEHIFSSSNELARSTWHANPFHRHQSIEQHFAFWDDDKYAALSKFYSISTQITLTRFPRQVFFCGVIIERPWQISTILQQNSLPSKMPLISLTLTLFVFMLRSVNISTG